MSSKKVYDVVKTERKEGREKPFYSNVGSVWKTEKGYLKLNIPLLGWFDLFAPRTEGSNKAAGEAKKHVADSLDSDTIPF